MLTPFSTEQKDALTTRRPGETRLGEKIEVIFSPYTFGEVNARFVLLGIREDIGIRANAGKGGAAECWDYAIASLLNVQSNRFLEGSEMAVAGTLDFRDLLQKAASLDNTRKEDLNHLREMTAEIDTIVSGVINRIVRAGKIPIIIGGGHNNAYGNIRGVSEALGKPVPVMNIDPHTDYRIKEGRHSGNGFRYAREEGYLDKYGVYGLHEGYNGKNILEEFDRDENLAYRTFESLLWRSSQEQDHLFKDLLRWFGPDSIGLELDLDSITRFPVSALNPSGFSLNEVRHLLRTATALKNPLYLHICEGSPGRAANDAEREMLGKSIAYLITDFVKAYEQ